MPEADPAYIAIAPCGCIAAATVARPEYAKDTAASVAEWICDGLVVERTTVGEARARPNFLRCEHGDWGETLESHPNQLVLAEASRV